jgi:hypothetical protein
MGKNLYSPAIICNWGSEIQAPRIIDIGEMIFKQNPFQKENFLLVLVSVMTSYPNLLIIKTNHALLRYVHFVQYYSERKNIMTFYYLIIKIVLQLFMEIFKSKFFRCSAEATILIKKYEISRQTSWDVPMLLSR